MTFVQRLMLLIVAPIGAHVLLGGAAPPGVAVPAAGATARRPNIVLILTDDQSLGSLAYMPRTLDLLARQGVTFANHVVPLSLCCPSRATILTGLYPHNHKVYTNFPPDGGFERFAELGHEETALAAVLRAAGYRTALLGKYLNGYPGAAGKTYVPPGWDEWASPVAGSPYAAYRFTLNENGKTVKYGSGPEAYMTDVLAGKATAFIRGAAAESKPFFLFLATFAPHSPATPARRHAGLFPDLKAPRGPSFNEADVRDKPQRIRGLRRLDDRQIGAIDVLYRKQILSLQAVDEAVAAVVRALRETGQLADTYLIFTSDNGFHMGHHRLEPGKYTPYEPDVRVPLLVRGPGVPAGATAAALTSSVDLAPTIAGLAGAALPFDADGRSLVPVLRGQRPATWRQAVLLEQFEFPPAPPRRGKLLEPSDPGDETRDSDHPAHLGVRSAAFKFVEHGTGEREVYDLKRDPDELVNLRNRVSRKWLLGAAQLARELGSCAGEACRQIEARPVPRPF
jgi:arylsulfatase A-like enzyme